MKTILLAISLFGLAAALLTTVSAETPPKDGKLQHVVALKFKEGTTPGQIKKIEEAFVGLKRKIPQIAALEWGINNSTEGLDKGFTHCFILTFRSEKDRDIYLPHPDHKAFVEIIKPVLEDAFVIDFWSRQ